MAMISNKKIEKIMCHLALIGEDILPINRAKVIACIYYKNKIISIGYSQYKTHPFQNEFKKNEHSIFLHAEVDSINKAKKRLSSEELKKSTLFICRPKIDAITCIKTFGISKPCKGCQKCIEHHFIKNVYYTNTTNDGTLEITHLENNKILNNITIKPSYSSKF